MVLIASTKRVSDRLILLVIRSHDLSPTGGGAFPGHQRIAGLSGLSQRYVRNRLGALSRAGSLVVERRGPNPAVYHLCLKGLDATTPLETMMPPLELATEAKDATLMPPPEGDGYRSNYIPPPTPPNRRRNKKTATPDELAVLEHYQTVHRKRKVLRDGLPVSERLITIVRTALGWGFSPAELIEAIDGNLQDPWHYEKRKHELAYILRTSEKVDDFRDRYDWGQQPSDLVRTPTA